MTNLATVFSSVNDRHSILAEYCTEPDCLPSVRTLVESGKGSVVITSSLGMDVFDNFEPVDYFVVAASGQLTPVQTVPAADWDCVLISLATQNTAALEVDDVRDVGRVITQLVSSGCTPFEAIKSLM